jgi:hypothetical protein
MQTNTILITLSLLACTSGKTTVESAGDTAEDVDTNDTADSGEPDDTDDTADSGEPDDTDDTADSGESDDTDDTADSGESDDTGDIETSVSSNHWRVVNVTDVGDHWNISELTFYTDSECTRSLRGSISDVLVVTRNDCDVGGPDVLHNGIETFSGHCMPGNWANNPERSDPGEIWVGYALSETSPVGCVTISQSTDPTQRVTEVTLEMSEDEGETWIAVDTIRTESTSVVATTVFLPE